jgi:hypothetical protein
VCSITGTAKGREVVGAGPVRNRGGALTARLGQNGLAWGRRLIIRCDVTSITANFRTLAVNQLGLGHVDCGLVTRKHYFHKIDIAVSGWPG